MVISFSGWKGHGARGLTGSGGMGAPMRHAMLTEMRAYWEGLRHGPGLPRRADIDPRGIEGVLESAFLLERIAPGIARFRLAGMHLVDLMGMEVRGMPLSAMVEPASRERLYGALEQVFVRPAAMTLALVAERGIGRPALEGRMLILPLLGDTGEVDQALGCLATDGGIGRSPRRFAIAGVDLASVGAEVVHPFAPAPRRAAPMAEPLLPAGFAEPQPGYRPAPPGPQGAQGPQGRPHLRLIKTDE